MVKPITSIQLFNRTNKQSSSQNSNDNNSLSEKIKNIEKENKEIKIIAQHGSDLATNNKETILKISEDNEQNKKDILELKASVKPKTEEPLDTPQGQVYLKAFYIENDKQIELNKQTTQLSLMTQDTYKKVSISYRNDLMGGIYLKIKTDNETIEKTLPVFYFNNFNAFRVPFREKISLNTQNGIIEGFLQIRVGNGLYIEFERISGVDSTINVEAKFMINVAKEV